jgi:Protein of unknown function (DUF1559)
MTSNRARPWSLIALAAVSMAVPASPSTAQQPAQPVQPADRSLAAVPTDAFLFASVKVSKLWDNPAVKPLRDWYAVQKLAPLDSLTGLKPDELDRVTVFKASWDPELSGGPIILVTTRKPYNEAAVLRPLLPEKPGVVPQRFGPTSRAFKLDGPFGWVVFVDERTILFLTKDADNKALGPNLLAQLISRKSDGLLAAAIVAAQTHDVTAAVDMRGVEEFARLIQAHRSKEVIPFLSLLKSRTATLTADFDKSAKIQFTLAFADAETARRAAPVVEEAIKFLHKQWSEDRFIQAEEVGRIGVGWVLGVLKSAKVGVVGTSVVAGADVPFAEDLAKFVAVLPKEFGKFQTDSDATNNLKQLGLGMHNMHDVYNGFPGDVGTGPKPSAWSWRVQILPFIEQDNLYKILNHNVAWDDPANLKILAAAEMPKVFEHPGRPAPKGHTYFRIFSIPTDAKGGVSPFFREGVRGPRFTDVTDGLSNTLMIVEAEEAVPWYKPDVLAYDGKLPLPPLGANGADKFLAVMGDGSIKVFRPSKLGEKTLRALITINGGEVFELPK